MNMQYVSVQVKTRKHIEAFLKNNYGSPARFDRTTIFHNHFILCLSHTHFQHANRVADYPVQMKIQVPVDVYERYGCYVNEVQNKFFNTFVDAHMKVLLVNFADTYLHMDGHKNLTKAIQYSMDMMRVSEDDWEFDSVKRFYHRYRIRNGKPLIYQKDKKIEKPSGKTSDLLIPQIPINEIRSN